jgi:hypothetical protein
MSRNGADMQSAKSSRTATRAPRCNLCIAVNDKLPMSRSCRLCAAEICSSCTNTSEGALSCISALRKLSGEIDPRFLKFDELDRVVHLTQQRTNQQGTHTEKQQHIPLHIPADISCHLIRYRRACVRGNTISGLRLPHTMCLALKHAPHKTGYQHRNKRTSCLP